eukprot:6049123-Amphidinium_carterae.1
MAKWVLGQMCKLMSSRLSFLKEVPSLPTGHRLVTLNDIPFWDNVPIIMFRNLDIKNNVYRFVLVVVNQEQVVLGLSSLSGVD